MATLGINGTANGWQYKAMDWTNGWFDTARQLAANHPARFDGGQKTAYFMAGGDVWEYTIALKQLATTQAAREAIEAVVGEGAVRASIAEFLADRQARRDAHQAVIDGGAAGAELAHATEHRDKLDQQIAKWTTIQGLVNDGFVGD